MVESMANALPPDSWSCASWPRSGESSSVSYTRNELQTFVRSERASAV